ncbi:MAG: hypothetical protein AAGB15_07945, partial [Pseudomonadota bacterium]
MRSTSMVAAALTAALLGATPSGATEFQPDEDGEPVLWMFGEINDSTPSALAAALQQHPNTQWIVLAYVPGSDGDYGLIESARIIRQRGLGTGVPEDGYIASGGTDLLLSGAQRIVERGACIGVHSWSDDDDPTPPTQLPRDHEGHKVYLDYLDRLGMAHDFYWFTINAAPFEKMHYMSEAELSQFRVATSFDGSGGWSPSGCEARA